MKRGADRGSVLLLTIGFTAIALLAVAVAADVSRLWLERRALSAAADAAALAGTRALDLEAYYADGLGTNLPLDERRVRAAVRRYVTAAGLSTKFDRLRADVSSDGTTVTVTLTSRVRLPLTAALDGGTATVEATARARASVG